MQEREEHLLGLVKDVPRETLAAQSQAAMTAASEARFRERVHRVEASQQRVEPVHAALRSALADSPHFSKVSDALRSLDHKSDRPALPHAAPAPAPDEPRLKLGSFHLIDVPPFEAKSSQESQGNYKLPPPTADGTSGNMALNVSTGFDMGPVHVSCWAAVGQFYSVPHDPSIDAHGGLLRFSATPSFSWSAFWSSVLWQLASGEIWVGLTVNEFDSAGAWTATPFSLRFPLITWNDYNVADDNDPSGQSTGFQIPPAIVFVQPGHNYECLVMIGADAFGNWPEPIESYAVSVSECSMTAHVSQLILDTFDL